MLSISIAEVPNPGPDGPSVLNNDFNSGRAYLFINE